MIKLEKIGSFVTVNGHLGVIVGEYWGTDVDESSEFKHSYVIRMRDCISDSKLVNTNQYFGLVSDYKGKPFESSQYTFQYIPSKNNSIVLIDWEDIVLRTFANFKKGSIIKRSPLSYLQNQYDYLNRIFDSQEDYKILDIKRSQNNPENKFYGRYSFPSILRIKVRTESGEILYLDENFFIDRLLDVDCIKSIRKKEKNFFKNLFKRENKEEFILNIAPIENKINIKFDL